MSVEETLARGWAEEVVVRARALPLRLGSAPQPGGRPMTRHYDPMGIMRALTDAVPMVRAEEGWCMRVGKLPPQKAAWWVRTRNCMPMPARSA